MVQRFLGAKNSIILLIFSFTYSEREFKCYWLETGTPSSPIKLMANRVFYIPEMEQMFTDETIIGSFDIDFIEPENLLFQNGHFPLK